MHDLRNEVARFYDAATTYGGDVEFYMEHIDKDNPTILELGCGTGRVTIPLANNCEFIHGVDISSAMLTVCKEKIEESKLPKEQIKVELADITKLELNRKFGLIVAPYRVFQNLASDEETDGFFDVVKRHLAPGGACILNVFNPKSSAEDLIAKWSAPNEQLEDETPHKDGVVKSYVVKSKITTEPLVIHPTLIYRYFEGEKLEEEVQFEVPMRVYYPDEFKKTIEDHGFKIVESWGGYKGQPYGEFGGELVVKFVRA
jgi:ubiquinone/menaquinone biosynthesis C-methylase UbiE